MIFKTLGALIRYLYLKKFFLHWCSIYNFLETIFLLYVLVITLRKIFFSNHQSFDDVSGDRNCICVFLLYFKPKR